MSGSLSTVEGYANYKRNYYLSIGGDTVSAWLKAKKDTVSA
jgi:hypothetical protein